MATSAGQAAIWKHFTPVEGKPDLDFLQLLSKYTSKGGKTSSLHNHLRISHKEQVKEIVAEKEKLNTNKKYCCLTQTYSNIKDHTNEYPNIFVLKKMIRTNIRIYLYKKAYERIYEYIYIKKMIQI